MKTTPSSGAYRISKSKHDYRITRARLWVNMIRMCREVSAPGHKYPQLRGLTVEQAWPIVRELDDGTLFESGMFRCMFLLGLT